MENTSEVIHLLTLDNGGIMKGMVTVSTDIQMAMFMKASLRMVLSMDRENIVIPLEIFTKGPS